jgi:hypothetical protein
MGIRTASLGSLLLLLTAQAGASKRMVVLESYVERRPSGTTHAIERIIQALGPENVLAGDELRKKLLATFSHPVTQGTADELQTLLKMASDGAVAYSSSSFSIAVSQLSQAAEGLAKQPIALAQDEKLREVRRETLLNLAKVQVKMNNIPAAQATLREVFRSFPDIHGLSETQYPPRVVALAKDVLREKASSSGALSVETQPSHRRIYVDDLFVGTSPKAVGGLLPGSYRVFVPDLNGDTRRGSLRIVEVGAHDTAKVKFDTELDDKLEIDEFVGLRFRTRDEKQRSEIPLASAIAARLSAQEFVVLTDQRSPTSERELLGAVYDIEKGHREWGVILPFSSEPDEAALARFALSLRTRRAVEGIKVAPPETGGIQGPSRSEIAAAPPLAAAPRVRPSSKSLYSANWKLTAGLLTVLGAATLGAGLGVYFHYDCQSGFNSVDGSVPCSRANQGPNLGSFLPMLIGSGSLIVGFVMWVAPPIDAHIHPGSVRQWTVGLAPSGNGVVVSFSGALAN